MTKTSTAAAKVHFWPEADPSKEQVFVTGVPPGALEFSSLIHCYSQPDTPSATNDNAFQGAALEKRGNPDLLHWHHRLRTLKADRAAINEEAIGNARAVIDFVLSTTLKPERLVAMAEGGAAFYFFGAEILPGGSHNLYASIECPNTGELVCLLGTRKTGARNIFQIFQSDDIPVALNRIERHLAT